MPFKKGVTVNQVYHLLKRHQQAKTDEERQQLVVTLKDLHASKICLFWKCERTIPEEEVLCREHAADLKNGLIDECPNCGQAKSVRYKVCAQCHDKAQAAAVDAESKDAKTPTGPDQLEYSAAWDKLDAQSDQFFAYVLRLDGGKLYAGHTRELRERLEEHRTGTGGRATSGKNPRLVWFGMLPTREAATDMEAKLKKLIASNPRQINRMIVGFRDLVNELDYS